MSRAFDPNLETLKRIAEALDAPVSRFFDVADPPLDKAARKRIELSLQELLETAPSLSKAELQARLLDLVAELKIGGQSG